MAPDSTTPRPKWRRHHSVAATLLVVGAFAFAAVGAAAGSTIPRAPEQKLAVAQVVTAPDVSYVLTKSGEVYSEGLNNFGQLGVGDLVNRSEWKAVRFPSEQGQPRIKKLSTDGEHVLALDTAGGLWTWGSSESGALGTGANIPALTPQKLSVSYSFEKLATGDDFAVAIDSLGSLYTWGQNKSGQLGNGSTNASQGPTILNTDGNRFTEVSAGSNYAMAIDESGALWAWGSNDSGQFGNGNKTSANTPQRVSDGPWKMVAASRFSKTVLAVNKNGELYSWGSGANALLGVGSDWRAEQQAENQRVADEIARIKAEDEARKQSLSAQLTQNKIDELHKAWEEKNEKWLDENPQPEREDYPQPIQPEPQPSQTPQPGATASPSPTASPTPQRDLYKEAVDAWAQKRNSWLSANPEPVSSAAISDNDKNAIAAEVEKQFKPTDTSGLKPRKIPEPKDPKEQLTPTKISSIVNFVTASVGSENAFAIDVLGRLWAWGSDKSGQSALGYDENTHTHLPLKVSEASYRSVFAGDKWATVVGNSGVYTWGANNKGNALQSAEAMLKAPTKIREGSFAQVTGGTQTAAATQTDGSTVTWGANTSGLAGRNAKDASVGVDQIEGRYRVVGFSKNGALALDNGPGNLYFWGSDEDKISAADKPFTSDVLKPTRQTVASFMDVATGRLSSTAVDGNGFVWTWGLSWNAALNAKADAIEAPTQMPVGVKVKRVAAAQTDFLLVTENDELRWWGANSPRNEVTGIDQNGADIGTVEDAVGGRSHFLIRNASGEVFSFATASGAQFEGQTIQKLSKVDLPGAADEIAAGGNDSVAVVKGRAFGWGFNASHELSPDKDESLPKPTGLPAPYAGEWSKVSVSTTHFVGASNREALYGWGHTEYVQGLDTVVPTKPIHLPITAESN